MFQDRTKDMDTLKQQIDQSRPLPMELLPQLKEYFRIGLTYSSNAIEGNTLTETETKVILEDGLTIGGKTLKEHLEVLGHSDAYDFMYKQSQNTSFTENDLLELHRLFYHRIDEQNAGKYRTSGIFVTGTDFEFPEPKSVAALMKTFITQLPDLKKKYHPVLYAALVHRKFVTIHPFVDGNGRTARLLMNLTLLQQGYPITIIPPVMRSHYISSVRLGNKGDEKPFLDFISEMVYESTKDYLRLIKHS